MSLSWNNDPTTCDFLEFGSSLICETGDPCFKGLFPKLIFLVVFDNALDVIFEDNLAPRIFFCCEVAIESFLQEKLIVKLNNYSFLYHPL